jgi:hypothetical protein
VSERERERERERACRIILHIYIYIYMYEYIIYHQVFFSNWLTAGLVVQALVFGFLGCELRYGFTGRYLCVTKEDKLNDKKGDKEEDDEQKEKDEEEKEEKKEENKEENKEEVPPSACSVSAFADLKAICYFMCAWSVPLYICMFFHIFIS